MAMQHGYSYTQPVSSPVINDKDRTAWLVENAKRHAARTGQPVKGSRF